METLISSPKDIDVDRFYALPHEQRYMDTLLERIQVQRGDLSEHIRDAMEQSSETWHDNAPADALFGELKQLDVKDAALITARRRLTVINYPPVDLPFVTMGSRVHYAVSGNEFHMDITGNLPFSIATPPEVEAGSVAAPLPQAMLGKEQGEEAELVVNRKVLHMAILAIDQVAQQEFYGSI